MRRKQLLFSKREKAEKSTTMGEDNDNPSGNLGVPNNNSQNQDDNNDKISKDQQNLQNEEDPKKIENVSNEVFNNENENKKPKKNLNEELEKLKQELAMERDQSITKISELNEEDIQKNNELKMLTTKFNSLIQILKSYDQNLIIRTRSLSKYKETEEQIKKQIKVTEAQIKSYEERASFIENDYNSFKKKVESDKRKENELNIVLNGLNSEISEKNGEIKFLKITSNAHLYCASENKKLLDRFAALNTAYKYELKRAKQLALIEIDTKDENDQMIKEEYDQIDDKVKAEEDEKNILPKIKVLRFRGEKVQKLEMKIIKRNKIGINKSSEVGNGIKYYKKLNSELNDNERYEKQKYNSLIRKNKNNDIQIEENYLFNKNEEKIMEKVLPEEMFNTYKNKFNDMLLQTKEVQDKLKTDSNSIKKENESITNKCEYNKMELKNKKIENLKLVMKSQKLRDKINHLKQNIKALKEKMNKEDKKLKEENRINNYYTKLKKTQELLKE